MDAKLKEAFKKNFPNQNIVPHLDIDQDEDKSAKKDTVVYHIKIGKDNKIVDIKKKGESAILDQEMINQNPHKYTTDKNKVPDSKQFEESV